MNEQTPERDLCQRGVVLERLGDGDGSGISNQVVCAFP